MADRVEVQRALQALVTIQATHIAANIRNDPTGIAAVRALGPMANLPENPTEAERMHAGSLLLPEVLRETSSMPGDRLKAAVDCARIALQLQQAPLALPLVELGRAIQTGLLQMQWATQLEALAARVYEAPADHKSALTAERRARTLERTQHTSRQAWRPDTTRYRVVSGPAKRPLTGRSDGPMIASKSRLRLDR